MNTKKDLNFNGLKDALNERKIQIKSRNDEGVVSINIEKGIFIGEVFPLGVKKRVLCFSKTEGDYLDPSLYGFKAMLGVGLEILLQPIF